jgi:hypothetical protein
MIFFKSDFFNRIPQVAAFSERLFQTEKLNLMQAHMALKIAVSFSACFYPLLAVSEL